MDETTPRIEGYRIERMLAEGGMGVVYRAIDERLGRPVAVKMIRGELLRKSADGDDAVARFMREARSAAQISSNHVAHVLQFGETARGDLYLVLEYLNGMGLDALLKQERRLPVQRAVHIARQICRGLAAAHELGIVHRDLKPANVFLVDQDGQKDFVKILDFGVAKVQGEAESHATKAGMLVGTYTCMAPEQVLGNQIDARTDVYSLAVLLFRMLTGKQLFEGDNVTAVLYHHVHSAPRRPNDVAPDIGAPKPLEMVILRCLDKDPARRIPTMMDLERALGAAVDFSTSAPVVVDPLAATIAVGSSPSLEVTFSPTPSPVAPGAETRMMPSGGIPAAPSDPPTPSTSMGRLPAAVHANGDADGFMPPPTTRAAGGRSTVTVVAAAASAGILLAVALVVGLWWVMKTPAAQPTLAATVTAKPVAATRIEPSADDGPLGMPPVGDGPDPRLPTETEPTEPSVAPLSGADRPHDGDAGPAVKVEDLKGADSTSTATKSTSTKTTATKSTSTKKTATKSTATKSTATKPTATKSTAKTKKPAAKPEEPAPVKKKPGFIRVRTGDTGG